jgi:hypothetical protein
LGKRNQELWFADEHGEDSNVKAVEKQKINIIRKTSRSEVKTSQLIYLP